MGNEVPTECLQALGESGDFIALGVAHEEVAGRAVCETNGGRGIDGVAAGHRGGSVIKRLGDCHIEYANGVAMNRSG